MRVQSLAVAGLYLLSTSFAHPGHDLTQEKAERRSFLESVRRASLGHCAETLKARGVEARNAARRSAQVQDARVRRGLSKRDADSVLAESHNETDLGYTLNTDASTLFSSNNSCVLTPEVTQGPYCMYSLMTRTTHLRTNVSTRCLGRICSPQHYRRAGWCGYCLGLPGH